MSAVLVAVCVKDLAAGAFNRPFFVPSAAVAVRSFRDEVNRRAEDNQMFSHPEDFELYAIGTFVEATAEFIQSVPVERLARAKDLKES